MTRRIVRLISGLMVMLMVTPAAVLAQAPPPPGSPIGDLLVMAGETLTLSGRSDHVWGNITVEPSATLVVTASTLYMESDGAWISLAQGGALRLTAGGAIKDSPTDTDDGSAADFAYSITAAAGASIESEGSSLEGASRIDAMDASVELVGSVVRMSRGPITLSGMSVLRAVNSSLVQGVSPAIAVEGSSQARVEGRGMPSYTVAATARFSYGSFAAVTVRDSTSKPLGGAEWSFESAAGVLAGSAGLGGGLPTTRLDHEGFPAPTFALVPHLEDTGGSKTWAGVVARAKYAEWTDARVLDTSQDQFVNFTALNRGFALSDISEHAMLDNMGMHDMEMGAMGGMMGMEEMMGPMMTQGPGAAWGDFNGDGHVDAVLTSAPETDSSMLFPHVPGGMNATDYPAPELFLGDGMGMFMPGMMEGNMSHMMPGPMAEMDPMMMSGLEVATGATGVSAGDFDGDGDLDVFVARYGASGMVMEEMPSMRLHFEDGMPLAPMLFENDGHGMFKDVTAKAAITMGPSYTVGGVWGDYNRDGCLDLFVVNMGQFVTMMPMDEGAGMGEMHMGMDVSYVKPVPDVLYKNNCDGTFTNATAAAGQPNGGGEGIRDFEGLVMDPQMMNWYANQTMKNPAGSGVGYTAAWIDFNEDGWPDLLVGNDFGVSPLYKNNGDGTFTLWTEQAGLSKVGSAMGFAVADFNRDGHLDIFQSNFNEDYLWVSGGDGTFTDRAFEWGVADMAVGWGVASPDIDADGYPDLVISTGYMSMMMKASEQSALYRNDGGRRFWDASAGSGFGKAGLGISASLADVNGDLRPDIFLGYTDQMNRMYLNREGMGNAVRLDLHGIASNAYGVGAEVTALIGGKPFRAVLQPGGEYASSNEPGLFIGLGASSAAQRVTVYWPSGIVQSVGDVPAGTRLTVREDAGAPVDAGPDGVTNSSAEALLVGSVGTLPMKGATYTWVFHGPTTTSGAVGREVMFTPSEPGVYAVELIVKDRFGDVYGTDFCVLRVSDTTAPTISVEVPKTITASGSPTFDASGSTDNDPAFKAGAKFEWVFRNGGLEVAASGAKPTVQLPKPGVWNVTVKATDPSGNTVTRQFDARVTGTAPATVTTDMVLWAIALSTLSLVGIAYSASRIWPAGARDESEANAESIQELRPRDILVALEAADAADPSHAADSGEEE